MPLPFQEPHLRTHLMAAIETGYVEETRRLLSNGADVNSKGGKMTLTEGHSEVELPSCPLLWAVIKRDAAIVKVLLEAGANPELPCDLRIHGLPGRVGIIAHAVQNGDEDIVRYLLEAGTDVSGLLGSGFKGFFKWAAWSNHHLLNILVQYGADVNRIDAAGETDLHKAIRYFRQDSFCVVERLLGLGIDVNLSNSRNGITPLMVAIKVKSPQAVVELLLTNGADPHSRDHTGGHALHVAAQRFNLWALGRLLQENIDLEAKRNHHLKQLTPFEYLCEKCHDSFASHNEDWMRPLHCLRAMNILMKAGAKLSSGDDTELIEELYWFREQAEIIYKDDEEEEHLEEIRNILGALIWKCSNVDTLRHLCRLKMRTLLKFSFKQKLQTLSLPGALFDYILMKDLLPPFHLWNLQ